jgi:hypothetical protein
MRTAAILTLALTLGVGIGLVNVEHKPQPELRDSFKRDLPKVESKQTSLIFAIGKATYFDATKNNAWYTRESGGPHKNQRGGPYKFYAAAGPKLRELCGKRCNFDWGKVPYRVIVTNAVSGRSIIAWVVDWCQCSKGKTYEKLIDLAPEAWKAIAGPDIPYSRGVLKVKVEVIP